MEDLFQAALVDPSLKVKSLSAWAAINPQHKELIYTALDQAVQNTRGPFSSISHTHTEGGFAVSKFPVGFDLEVTSRVTLELVTRISFDEELTQAPDFASLWCAKEAAFKALKHFKQPKVVSQIKINFDKNHQGRCPLFTIENEKDFGALGGIGATYSTSNLTYCVLIFKSEF